MYSSLLPFFCLLCISRAGQVPSIFDFASNTCSIEKLIQNPLVVPNGTLDLDNLSANTLPPKGFAKPTSRWTRKRKCVEDDNTYHQFCVYTDEGFANGRGISLFTEPQIAKTIAALPAFTEEGVHKAVNNFDNPPWEVRTVPGKGEGLYAKRDIQRGEQILATTPVGVYQSDAFFPDFPLGYPYLRLAYEQLPNATIQLVNRMAAHNDGDFVMERVNTNAFAGDFEGQAHFLLYPETAKMNHDCRPNAMYYYDSKTLIHSTHASRTILAGEEITITYINVLQFHSARRENLQSIWGFKCTCSHCTASSTETRISDSRVEQIIDLQTKLSSWDAKSTTSPALAEKLLMLYEQENIHAAKGIGHMWSALAYNAVGNLRKARINAEKALDFGIVGAPDRENLEPDMKALLADARGHWSYMARRRP